MTLRQTRSIRLSFGSFVTIAVFAGLTSIAFFTSWAGNGLLLDKFAGTIGACVGWSLFFVSLFEFFRSGMRDRSLIGFLTLPSSALLTIGILILVTNPRGNVAVAGSIAVSAIYTSIIVLSDLFFEPDASGSLPAALDEKQEALAAYTEGWIEGAAQHVGEGLYGSCDSGAVDFCCSTDISVGGL